MFDELALIFLNSSNVSHNVNTVMHEINVFMHDFDKV